MAHRTRPVLRARSGRAPRAPALLFMVGALVAAMMACDTGRLQWPMGSAHAQESGQWVVGQVVKLDTASKKVTIRAIMGFQELRAKRGELLESVKVGDQVRLQVGPDGTEKVITALEVIR